MNKKEIMIKILKIIPIVLLLVSTIYVVLAVFDATSITDLLIEYLGSIALVLAFIGFVIVILVLIYVLSLISKRKPLIITLGIILVITSISMIYVSNTAMRINNSLNNIVDDNSLKSIYIVSLDSSEYAQNLLNENEESNSDIIYNDATIGLLSNTSSFEGNILPFEYYNEKEGITNVIYYQSWLELVEGLINGEVDIITLPSSYESLFTYEEFANVDTSSIKNVDKYSKEVITSSTLQGGKPFSILILAVDKSIYDGNINGLYDVVVLVTFIPETGEIVMNSIPRDTTLKSPCIYDQYDKINHNGNPYLGEGTDCIVQTVENAFETNVDYSLVVGFSGMMEVIDHLGGVYIDNQYGDFWGQNENRVKYSVFVPGGYNLLDGQQALSYARNRSQGSIGSTGAIERSQSHITVIKAILDRMIEKNVFTDLSTFLNIIANNTYTDFPMNDLVALNKLAQNFLLSNELNIYTVSIEGITGSYNSPLSSIPLSGFKPYVSSMEEMVNVYNLTQDYEPFIFEPEFDMTSLLNE